MLRPTDQLTSTYPHPTAYEPYNVVYYKEDDIFGMHPDDMCDRIQLTKQDVIKYEFDLRKFREILSKILGFHESQEDFPYNTRVIPLGFWEETGGQTYPVLLVMPTHTKSFAEIMFQLFATKTSPMIIITPTNRFWAKEAIELFPQRKSIVISLHEIIEVNDNVWTATDEWGKTLQNFRDLLRPPHLIEVPLYEFRKKGEIWVIRYEGDDMYLKDSVGVQCISQLLSKPNDPVFVMELRAIVNGQKPESVALIQTRDNVVDTETLTNLKRRYLELQSDLEETQRDGNEVAEKEIEEEMEQIVQYLCQAKTKGGEIRKMNDDFEKSRSATSKAFWRTINLIRNELPQLADYLEKSCVVGVVCNYNPEHRIDWIL